MSTNALSPAAENSPALLPSVGSKRRQAELIVARRAAKPSLSNPIPDSVPHFSSFDHVADPRRRRALEYEQELLALLDRFDGTEIADRLKRDLAWAREQTKRDQQSDRDRVFNALRAFDSLTCREISEDLDMPYQTVWKLLRELLDCGLVGAREQKRIGGGKPTLLFYQIHEK